MRLIRLTYEETVPGPDGGDRHVTCTRLVSREYYDHRADARGPLLSKIVDDLIESVERAVFEGEG